MTLYVAFGGKPAAPEHPPEELGNFAKPRVMSTAGALQKRHGAIDENCDVPSRVQGDSWHSKICLGLALPSSEVSKS